MTDITPDLNITLSSKGAQPVLKKAYDVQTLNAFLQEAYSIVRQSVLSGFQTRTYNTQPNGILTKCNRMLA